MAWWDFKLFIGILAGVFGLFILLSILKVWVPTYTAMPDENAILSKLALLK